ncbi:beta-microseminoprotein-like [Lissotriton helveticus]
MKFVLALGLVSIIAVSLCYAQCFNVFNPLDSNGCQKDGKKYEYGETFIIPECKKCTCTNTSLTCCAMAAYPAMYNKTECIAFLDDIQCKYRVVKKCDPCKKCEVTVWTL